MEKVAYKINIIGAGVSGLIAAQVLENEGYSATIYEATDRAGGRVKTDLFNGYQLDHGFQVLLDAYPMAKKYLDFKALHLQKFLPGAVIFKNGDQNTLGDPLRAVSLLFPTLFANIGNFSDKLKILKLDRELKGMSLEQLFASEEKSTLEFLKEKGFSDDIITSFFKPFFSGIFLEPHLGTSSRMFQFIYKMFGEGLAVLPKAGIGAIAEQLVSKLKNTNINYSSSVLQVLEGKLILKDGRELQSDFTLIATDPSNLVPNITERSTHWKSCHTFYFTTPKRNIKRPLIGLVADQNAIINNIFFHTSLDSEKRGEDELLSVTVVKEHRLNETELTKRVMEELRTLCGIHETTFLKSYHIKEALPQLSNLPYTVTPEQLRWSPTIYVAGDQQLYGSLNAAMITGEIAAKAILKEINAKYL
ncbi:NAD(P)/FAD-dependent oxidoreductase [Sediminicola sp. 1XM1-17]|uniref:NAD(P)/FAD-dependent oxidoreductase n=1 Tax=Sediminicola sp. 1XM1-17 TaxID=3127702 RepID=UPI003077059E